MSEFRSATTILATLYSLAPFPCTSVCILGLDWTFFLTDWLTPVFCGSFIGHEIIIAMNYGLSVVNRRFTLRCTLYLEKVTFITCMLFGIFVYEIVKVCPLGSKYG